MARNLQEPEFFPRDGTSQEGRVLPALDPSYVRVDERTVQDLVVFARELGRRLTYHGPDDRPAGTFSRFVGSLDPDVVADFLEHPERFDPATSPALFRPHFVLFLAFLRLFQKAQGEMNALTQRHLDFYFRRVLRMEGKGPVADRVHLLFDLARGEREVLVPKGTLVSAGPDSLRREQLYSTEQTIIVNRIRIAKKSSVFVERRRTGLRRIAAEAKSKESAFLEMLKVVLGDPLPRYPDGEPEDAEVDFAQLQSLRAELDLSQLDALRARARQAEVGGPPLTPEEQAKLGPVLAIGRYFFVPAERFAAAMDEVTGKAAADWSDVFSILEDAHREKGRAGRIARLRQLRAGSVPPARLADLVRYVLGEAESAADDPDAVDRLEPFLGGADFVKMKALHPVTDQDWESAYSLLEVAERNRLGEPPAERVKWINVHPAEDAAAGGARPALAGQDSSPRWATFGLARATDPDASSAPVLGWAVSSPLLWLREGERTIHLTLGIRKEGVDAKSLLALLTAEPGPLLFQVSTAKGWVPCPDVGVDIKPYSDFAGASAEGDLLGLRFTLAFDETAAPIAPLPPALAEIEGPGPLLRLLLCPLRDAASGANTVCYDELARLALAAVHLAVDAQGIRPQRLQSDERTLDPKKPFEPFGAAPALGSRFLLGHPEISGKRLDSLTLKLEWMGLPADLTAHYANYQVGGKKDPANPDAPAAPPTRLVRTEEIGVKLSMIDRGRETPLAANVGLFSGTMAPDAGWKDVEPPDPASMSATRLPDDVSAWRRHLQWRLSGSDLGHAAYPSLVTSKALDLAARIASKAEGEIIEADEYKLNPPYTPKLESLTLAYASSLEIRLDAGTPDAEAARVVHIHPFGHCDVHRDIGAAPLSAGVPLLPRYDNDGELYLGLAGVSAPQSVCLLFQLAEGSANPDVAPRPVEWSYLDGDRWLPFAGRVLRDTTQGLVSSGIVELALQRVAPSTRLRGGLSWIRASVSGSTDGVCDTIDIHPQAVSCVFVDRGNAPDHFRAPLPAGTIKKPSARIPGLAGVRQPYTSHGGRMAEDAGMWATRVSERLRHKQRALSMWDHERLVLERFPQIYKARCLPARPDEPGKVEVVVIPEIRDLLPSDPFEPKAPSSLLAEIEAYLRGKMPVFAEVKVKNARYVPVKLQLAVRFKEDGNDGFYSRKLNDEINRFLSPWAFEEGSDIVLGGRIYKNSIVDFVDRREYVDYVAGVKLFRGIGGDSYRPAPPPPEGEGDFVAADRPDAVLVAARTHEIIVLRDAAYDETAMSGINFMRVELDFIVA